MATIKIKETNENGYRHMEAQLEGKKIRVTHDGLHFFFGAIMSKASTSPLLRKAIVDSLNLALECQHNDEYITK